MDAPEGTFSLHGLPQNLKQASAEELTMTVNIVRGAIDLAIATRAVSAEMGAAAQEVKRQLGAIQLPVSPAEDQMIAVRQTLQTAIETLCILQANPAKGPAETTEGIAALNRKGK